MDRIKLTNASRPATIIDVAARAGVAIGTVSRHLNGLPIRSSNRDLIEEAIAALGYRRNGVAAAMKTDRTHMIGLLVPAFDEFHAAVLEHLARSIRRTKRALVTYCHSNDPRIFGEALEFFATQRVDALIADGTYISRAYADRLAEQNVPVILYNDVIPLTPSDRVVVDNFAASYRAVSHLLDMGHRRVAVLTGNLKDSSAKQRLEGYQSALSNRGIPLEESLVGASDWSSKVAYAAMKTLMSQRNPPTALFGSNYQVTIGALTWLKEQGMRVGEDLSIVSFDDVSLFRLHDKGITAISQPVAKIAESITDLVLLRLAGSVDLSSHTITHDCDIILRGSTQAQTLSSDPALT